MLATSFTMDVYCRRLSCGTATSTVMESREQSINRGGAVISNLFHHLQSPQISRLAVTVVFTGWQSSLLLSSSFIPAEIRPKSTDCQHQARCSASSTLSPVIVISYQLICPASARSKSATFSTTTRYRSQHQPLEDVPRHHLGVSRMHALQSEVCSQSTVQHFRCLHHRKRVATQEST